MAFVDPITSPLTPSTQLPGITEAQVYEVIADVLDPELDEPLVTLGFIDAVQIEGSPGSQDVTVIFKLPTFWCAPNFAYLMAADLRRSIRTLSGVRHVQVKLVDHCAEDEVTQGVNADRTFATAFADAASDDEDLEELRRTFLRKGFLMRQDTLLRHMQRLGLDEETIVTLRRHQVSVDIGADAALITLPERTVRLEHAGRQMHAYLKRAATLGLPHEARDLLITDDEGHSIAHGSLRDYLRRSRSVRLNITFNTSFCTSLFQTRYHEHPQKEISHP